MQSFSGAMAKSLERYRNNSLLPFRSLGKFCSLTTALGHLEVYIDRHLAIDSHGHVNGYSLHNNSSMAECFPVK